MDQGVKPFVSSGENDDLMEWRQCLNIECSSRRCVQLRMASRPGQSQPVCSVVQCSLFLITSFEEPWNKKFPLHLKSLLASSHSFWIYNQRIQLDFSSHSLIRTTIFIKFYNAYQHSDCGVWHCLCRFDLCTPPGFETCYLEADYRLPG